MSRLHGSRCSEVAGVDLFAVPDGKVGLSCRRYGTPDGYQGAPTLDQLRAVLVDA